MSRKTFQQAPSAERTASEQADGQRSVQRSIAATALAFGRDDWTHAKTGHIGGDKMWEGR